MLDHVYHTVEDITHTTADGIWLEAINLLESLPPSQAHAQNSDSNVWMDLLQATCWN